MKPETKSFIWGVLAGFVGTVLLAATFVVVASRIHMNRLRDTLEERISAPPVPEGQAAEFDWSARALDGTSHSMEMLRGQVAVLTFWKPGCFTCTELLRYLQHLAFELGDLPVIIAGISVGDEDGTREVIADAGIDLPVYLLEGERPAAYTTSTLPTTFVINARGRIAFRDAGVARWDDPAVATYIRTLVLSAPGD
jgi:peroxiredoxin